MLSLLSFKDEKDTQQQRQYYRNTCYSNGFISPKYSTHSKQQLNTNLNLINRQQSKSLSHNDREKQNKQQFLIDFNTQNQMKNKNHQTKRQIKKKMQTLDLRADSTLMNGETIAATQSINEKQNNETQNYKNPSLPVSSKSILVLCSPVNSAQMDKSKSVSFQQYFSESISKKQTLSKQGQIHNGRKFIKNLVTLSKQNLTNKSGQNIENGARIYNLQRIQSLILKRNNFIMQHDVKDYKEMLDKKFQKIKQQSAINDQSLNDSFYQFNNIKNGFQRAQSAKISIQKSQKKIEKCQGNDKQIIQEANEHKQQMIEESNQSQLQIDKKQNQKQSYDQVVEQTNLDFIEVNYPYKDDTYKIWRQSKSTIDHINHYQQSPSNLKSMNSNSQNIYNRTASAKSKSISFVSNQNISQVFSPQNSKKLNLNLSQLINEAKNQISKVQLKNDNLLDQQNDLTLQFKSQENTLISTSAGSPNFNYIYDNKDQQNDQIDNIDEHMRLSGQTKFDMPKKQYLTPQLSPESSPRLKISFKSNIRPQSSSINSLVNRKRISFQEEYFKSQPQKNIQEEITKIYQNKIIFNKKQQSFKNEKLQKDINQFLFQSSQMQNKQNNIKKLNNADPVSLNQSFSSQNQPELKNGCKSPQESSRPTSILLRSTSKIDIDNNNFMQSIQEKEKSTQKNKKQQNPKNKVDHAEAVRMSFLNQIQMKKNLKDQQQYIQFKQTKNKLNQKEILYFAQQRKKYFEPLKQDLDILKMNYGNDEDKFYEDWGILLQKTNYQIYDSMNNINNDEEKNYTIYQTNICREENGLFAKIQEINNFLKICNKNLTRKFARHMVLIEKQNNVYNKEREQNRLNQFTVCDNKLNIEELDTLIQQFQLDSLQKNYNKILTIVSKLQFFKKFSVEVNNQIINIAKLKTFEKNDIIFHQGDLADNMYIILKGSIHVRIKRQEDIDIQLKDPIITTIYDGYSFGDLALINLKIKQSKDIIETNQILTLREMRDYIKMNQQNQDKNTQYEFNQKQLQTSAQTKFTPHQKDIIKKFQNLVQKRMQNSAENKQNLLNVFQKASKIDNRRSATIEAAEKCYLLQISREDFTNILLNLILSEMEEKLNLLKNIPFLSDLDYTQLITLANYIEIKKTNLGDIVVREGQQPQYFYIIKKGKFEIVKEEIIIRSKESSNANQNKNNEKRLDFSQQNWNHIQIMRKSYEHDFAEVIQDNYINQKDEIHQQQEDTDNKSLNDSLELDFYKGLEGEAQQELPKERSTFKRNNLFCNEEQQQKYQEIQQAIREQYSEKDIRQYKKVYENGEELAYCYFHQIGTLQEGDFFMLRSLISEQCKVDQQILEQIDYDPNEKSRLTIISESNHNEIGMIDKKFLHLIAPNLKRVLIDGLISMKDFDHQFNRETREWIDRWDNMKVKIYKEHKKYK
ncbi:cyclic nucleotide-binding domain protein (macronuclear) [Tetrahymena thermophila SB210]|uniref:Cyclic nucleotide-binding domain protein n=1 Tax=Tetrahymena thermophila (strain SB210) TaxID=312017 RepID=I7M3E7_TETTS|nr:cyclic nucleotide-binding domain protein [Tetrahymena thermophila SB210]EAS03004.2 cyclic nucleotide-binding domain protein [Tetrahymena thermophila SB210]|eukprot:XP_001023249.2 cyclic nucleotide-binding domain protein [Tetrahymena thermophila SB210]